MKKKENKTQGGHTSLLQTARTKNYGGGKFASLSMNSGNPLEHSLSRAHTSDAANNVVGNVDYQEKTPGQSMSFFSLWPISTAEVGSDHDHHHHDHYQQQQQYKSKKLVKPSPGTKEWAVRNRKTMDISEGLRFSAPAPMTLNRYQPQIGQEKTAPESKEYVDRQEMWKKLKQTEAKHIAEAQMTIEERLKQMFGLEDNEKGNGFHDEHRKDNEISMKKKTMMKTILGKVRPKASTKLQQNQEKSSAIQEALAAAAAAVEAATTSRNGQTDGRNRQITEEEARAIVSHALSVSRQKKRTTSMHELLDDMFRSTTMERDRKKLAAQAISDFGRAPHFPVNEVTMNQNDDTISELDASLLNARKMPIAEIHTNNSKEYYGNESVSTLGTPRVFQQLDRLLLSEPQRLQQQRGIIRDFLADNTAPPPMVNARALIDQLDSGTMVGDMTAGTARAENAVQFCNLASNCFNLEPKSFFVESSARDRIFQSNVSALGNESFDVPEANNKGENNNETWSSPAPAFTQAIDNAIRRAEIQIASTQIRHRNKEVGETIDQLGSMNVAETQVDSINENAFQTQLHDGVDADEQNKTSKLEREKLYQKMLNLNNRANEVPLVDEGRFLLEKDDAYWDTLSTIASTANDQSSGSDAYMEEFIKPGPIPGEITAPSTEVKSATTPVVSAEGATRMDKLQRVKEGFMSRKGGNLNEMINDVTDLIDADLLDLPASKNRRPNTSLSHKPEMNSKKNLKASNRKMNQMKPRPEAMESYKLEETKSENLANVASQIGKGIRSVSWGVEEIYEDKNQHSDSSDQDTDSSESSYDDTRKSRPYPEGVHRNSRWPKHSNNLEQPRGEEDLLSRTLELSKGLLETIMGSQLVDENRTIEEVDSLGSDHSTEVKSQDHSDENPNSSESRDDFQHDDKIRQGDLSPTSNNGLENLRSQRSRALSKFRQSQKKMEAPLTKNNSADKLEIARRDRERSKKHSYGCDYGKLRSSEGDSAEYNAYPMAAVLKHTQSNDSEIDLKYTTSDSNASATPSQKARELRMQLDEAMRASREIQISQNELGNELNSFKRKYYKNPDIYIATKTGRDF